MAEKHILDIDVRVSSKAAADQVARAHSEHAQKAERLRRETEKTTGNIKKAQEQARMYRDAMEAASQSVFGFALKFSAAGIIIGETLSLISRRATETVAKYSTLQQTAASLSLTIKQLGGIEHTFTKMGLSADAGRQAITAFRGKMDEIITRGPAWQKLVETPGGPAVARRLEQSKDDLIRQLEIVEEFAKQRGDWKGRNTLRDFGLPDVMLGSENEWRKDIESQWQPSPGQRGTSQKLRDWYLRFNRQWMHNQEQFLMEGPPQLDQRGPGGKYDTPESNMFRRKISFTTADEAPGGNERAVRIMREGVFRGMRMFISGEGGGPGVTRTSLGGTGGGTGGGTERGYSGPGSGPVGGDGGKTPSGPGVSGQGVTSGTVGGTPVDEGGGLPRMSGKKLFEPMTGTMGGGVGGHSAKFGPRRHKGVDIMGKEGSDVYATQDGEVVKAPKPGGGRDQTLTIKHADGTYSRYLHQRPGNVVVGQKVKGGEIVGKSGYRNAPHTHYEMWTGKPDAPDSKLMNPKTIFGWDKDNPAVGGRERTVPAPGAPATTTAPVKPDGTSAPFSPGKTSLDVPTGPGSLAEQREKLSQELDADPALKQRLQGLVHAEVSDQKDPTAKQAFTEGVFNRAMSRKTTLRDQIYHPKYYPRITHDRAARGGPTMDDDLAKVRAGSNITNYSTGNASATTGVGDKTYETGGGTRGYRGPKERYGVEIPDRKWAAAQRARDERLAAEQRVERQSAIDEALRERNRGLAHRGTVDIDVDSNGTEAQTRAKSDGMFKEQTVRHNKRAAARTAPSRGPSKATGPQQIAPAEDPGAGPG